MIGGWINLIGFLVGVAMAIVGLWFVHPGLGWAALGLAIALNFWANNSL